MIKFLNVRDRYQFAKNIQKNIFLDILRNSAGSMGTNNPKSYNIALRELMAVL